MHTDLFLALRNPDNSRGHPILAALAYTFCPAAARWWMAGADPVLPFDPVWQALSDAAGEDRQIGAVPTQPETLKDVLVRYELGGALEKAVTYIDQIDSFRRTHQDIVAPELYPSFPQPSFNMNERFGLHNPIKNLGGVWGNFFVYVRTWAFLMEDWETSLQLEQPEVQPVKVGLILPGIRRPAAFPVMVWTKKHGRTIRNVTGLLVESLIQDPLRFAFIQQASLMGSKPWKTPPELWAFDRQTGETGAYDPLIPADRLSGVVDKLAAMAKTGPFPPIGALQNPTQCRACGYEAQCFTTKVLDTKGKAREISTLALGFG